MNLRSLFSLFSSDLAIDPADSSHYWAGISGEHAASNGLWESRDTGRTWTQQIGMSWLAYRLTGSTFLLGLIEAFVDRFDERDVLVGVEPIVHAALGSSGDVTQTRGLEHFEAPAVCERLQPAGKWLPSEDCPFVVWIGVEKGPR